MSGNRAKEILILMEIWFWTYQFLDSPQSNPKMSAHDVYSILPPTDVPSQQKLARKAATHVDYASYLDIQSRAAR